MPNAAEVIARNAATIATNTQTLDHLMDIGKLYGWIVGIVIFLLVYTWRQKEKSQDKLEELIVGHIKENDKGHNKIFDEIRGINHKVDTLIGAHEEITKNGGH